MAVLTDHALDAARAAMERARACGDVIDQAEAEADYLSALLEKQDAC